MNNLRVAFLVFLAVVITALASGYIFGEKISEQAATIESLRAERLKYFVAGESMGRGTSPIYESYTRTGIRIEQYRRGAIGFDIQDLLTPKGRNASWPLELVGGNKFTNLGARINARVSGLEGVTDIYMMDYTMSVFYGQAFPVEELQDEIVRIINEEVTQCLYRIIDGKRVWRNLASGGEGCNGTEVER